MIKIIMLDFNGVTGYWYRDVLIKNVSDIYGVELDEAEKLLFDENVQPAYEKGDITFNQFNTELCKLTGADVTYEEGLPLIEGTYGDNDEMVDYIREIKLELPNLKFVSAQNAAEMEVQWQKLNLPSLKEFDEVFCSAQLKMLKSDPQFFVQVTEKLKVKPEEILYFDDVEEYVDAAKSIGLKAYTYHSWDKMKEVLEEELSK